MKKKIAAAAPKRQGRPIAENPKDGAPVPIRFTKVDRILLAKEAKEDGLKFSTYVRRMALTNPYRRRVS